MKREVLPPRLRGIYVAMPLVLAYVTCAGILATTQQHEPLARVELVLPLRACAPGEHLVLHPGTGEWVCEKAKFRDLEIVDGHSSAFMVHGNSTMGDAMSDTHTINGNVTISGTLTLNGKVVTP